MARFLKTILLASIVVGGSWALLHRDQLRHPQQLLATLQQNWSAMMAGNKSPSSDASLEMTQPVIRIASFQLKNFGTQLVHQEQLPLLTEICRRYDVIALQGITGSGDDWLQNLAESINAKTRGGDYYFITDWTPSRVADTQNAILFNRRTVELDQQHWYTVEDPDDLMKREPLVGWFRTQTQNPQQAFTFSLVNVEMSQRRPDLELAYLGELFRAVRQDGHGEDDVILAGDFNAGDRGLEYVSQRAGLTWVVSNQPTDVRGTAQFDNLVFNPTATREFTGQGGVFDFMRQFNLRLQDAELLSPRLPVWAEFSVFEGGPSNADTSLSNASNARSAHR